MPGTDEGLERAGADERVKREWLCGLAGNPALPGDVLGRLLEFDELPTPRWLTMRKLDAEATAIVVASSHMQHRLDVVENHTADADVLMRLAYDAEPRVRFVYAVMLAEYKRRVPAEVLETLSRDTVQKVRRATAEYQWLPPAVQDRLVEDEDPQVRAAVLRHTLWERLAQPVREQLRNDPPPQVRAKVAQLSRPAEAPEVLTAGSRVVHAETHVRARAADDLEVPLTLAMRLAHDPENTVRLALSMREDLTEEQRASIRYEVPDQCPRPTWIQEKAADPEVARRIARSAHVGLRRALALRPHLPDDVVSRLATDEDPTVRRYLCGCQDAPHELLVEMYALGDRGQTVLRLHPNFARPGLARFADDPNPQLRMAALDDPEAGPELPLRLADDPDVGYWAVRDPRLPAGELMRRLTLAGSACAAAANPALPPAVMHQLIDLAQDR